MKRIKCYLAGAFVSFNGYSDWRDFFIEKLKDLIDFYDPRVDTHQGSIATFVYEDLVKGVEGSDIVLYFVSDICDVGAAIEAERGECKNKLVIVCIDKNVRFVHSFLLGVARRIFIGVESVLVYLRNLAVYGLENEFVAIEKTIEEINRK